VIGIVVRSARPGDHSALQRIYRRASLSNPGDRAGLLAQPGVLTLDDNLIGRGRTRVAALTDGTIIGFASTSAGDRGALELDDLFVDPDWRRHGAALRLVQQIASEAADEQIVLISVIANAHALEFYLAAGFENDGSTRTPLGVGIRMHLDIARSATFTADAHHGG
jgi:N-acetylglutamate synthase-like GNAT family acetyltransferase